jgi:hypothetical protein
VRAPLTSRGAHARLLARAHTPVTMAEPTSAASSLLETDPLHLNEPDLDSSLTDDTPPTDPRQRAGLDGLQSRTKASLKRFAYAPSGALGGFTIPKKKPAATSTATSPAQVEESGSYGLDSWDDAPPASQCVPRGGRTLGMAGWHPAQLGYGLAPSWDNYWSDPRFHPSYYEEDEEEIETPDETGSIGDLSLHSTAAVVPAAGPAPDSLVLASAPPDADADMLAQPEWDLAMLEEREAALGSETGPSVNPRLTTHVNTIWKRGSLNRVKELHDKHPRPVGVNLYKTTLNENIAGPLNAAPSPQAKFPYTRDLKLKGVQGLLTRAAVPVVRICEGIMRVDKKLTDKEHLDLALDGVTLMAAANQQLNQIRRDLLRPSLTPKIRAVCRMVKEEEPTEFVFPDFDESAKAAKQASGMVIAGRPGFGRARGGRRGGYTPYPSPGGFRPPFPGFQPRGGSFFGNRGECYYSQLSNNFLQSNDYLAACHSPLVSDKFVPLLSIDVSCLPASWLHAPTPLSNDAFSVCSRGSRLPQKSWRAPSGPGVSSLLQPDLVGEYAAPTPMVSLKWDYFQACRAKLCLATWRKYTSDPWLLRNVHGYKVEFMSPPVQVRPVHEIRLSGKETLIMSQEIATLLQKGVIALSVHEPNQFLSNVFLRDKKELGKYRMIFNLTQLNTFVQYRHFKMETLDTAIKMVTPGAHLASLDFTDAYYSLPLHVHHQKFFQIQFPRASL